MSDQPTPTNEPAPAKENPAPENPAPENTAPAAESKPEAAAAPAGEVKPEAAAAKPEAAETKPEAAKVEIPEGVKMYLTSMKFPGRGGQGWVGPLVDYKEIELLRKYMTTSYKMQSRKRVSANVQEQRDLKKAIKRARFMALLPYTSAHS